MRYHKGYIALSDTYDVPVILHIRNAQAVYFEQLCELLSFDGFRASSRSNRWRVARIEKAGLIARFAGLPHLSKPVFGITQSGLAFLESRGHYLLSLPSTTERILHPFQVPHALELVSIRLALAAAGLLRSWKCELEITSRNLVFENAATKDFDAIAEIEAEGGPRNIAIEYERSLKAAFRYQAIREILDKDRTADMVLYLAASDDILYLLASELSSSRKRMAFAMSEAFRHSLLDTRMLTNTKTSEVVLFRELLSD
jgi:hypothetical protein